MKSPLRRAFEHAINTTSAENGSDTPDMVLAEYLTDCLAAFDKAARARDQWYRFAPSLRGPSEPLPVEKVLAIAVPA